MPRQGNASAKVAMAEPRPYRRVPAAYARLSRLLKGLTHPAPGSGTFKAWTALSVIFSTDSPVEGEPACMAGGHYKSQIKS